MGGGDIYQNLILIDTDIHQLIHAKDEGVIQKYIKLIGNDQRKLDKLNKLREKAGNSKIERPNCKNNTSLN